MQDDVTAFALGKGCFNNGFRSADAKMKDASSRTKAGGVSYEETEAAAPQLGKLRGGY